VQRNLVERAQGGDRSAFAELAAASIARLFNVAQLMLRAFDPTGSVGQPTLLPPGE
jgi:hypothetical protein